MRTFIVNIDEALQGAEDDIDELERKWGAEEIEHKCHNCAHYLQGEYDGSCGSYICKEYSGWEQKDERMRNDGKRKMADTKVGRPMPQRIPRSRSKSG